MRIGGICFLLISCQLVATSLSIVPTRDLRFSSASPGANPEIISSASAGSSEFLVTGTPDKLFNVTLPAASVNMILGSHSIPTTQWECDTPSPMSLGPSGIRTIKIGATRGIVSANNPSGSYSGNHFIEVKYVSGGESHNAMAKHRVQIVRSLSLTRLTDLAFPDCYVGEAAQSVAPTDSGAATLRVTGDAYTAYSITFPTPLPVKMRLETGGQGKGNSEISLTGFDSIPSGTGKLDASGIQTILVGGTRSPIPSDQVAGSYSGSFLVRVSYH